MKWGVMASLGDENVLKCFLVMVAQLYEYTKTTGSFMSNEWITWYVNCILRKLLFKKKKEAWDEMFLSSTDGNCQCFSLISRNQIGRMMLSSGNVWQFQKIQANSIRLHRNNISNILLYSANASMSIRCGSSTVFQQ